MKTTLSNYENHIKEVSLATMPANLKAAHDFVMENGDLYNDDADIKKAIDLYFEKFDQWVAGQKKGSTKAKTHSRKTKAKTVKRATKTKAKTHSRKTKEKTVKRAKKQETPTKDTKKHAKTKAQPKKESVKGSSLKKLPKTNKLSKEPNYLHTMRGFIRLANKERSQPSVRKFLDDLQNRFDKRHVSGHTPHIEHIRYMQRVLVNAINSNLDKAKITVKVSQAEIENLRKITKGLHLTKNAEKAGKTAVLKHDLKGLPIKKKARSKR